tara:strand:- start:710 stop:826 length:117 start_codon:yes stop_codon:yes gene_type:complete
MDLLGEQLLDLIPVRRRILEGSPGGGGEERERYDEREN